MARKPEPVFVHLEPLRSPETWMWTFSSEEDRPVSVFAPDDAKADQGVLCSGDADPDNGVYCCRSVDVRPGQEIPIDWDRGRPISSRVVRAGLGVEGASVLLVPVDTSGHPLLGLRGPADLLEPARTDEEGRVRLPTVCPGEYRLEVRVEGRVFLGEDFAVSTPPAAVSADAPELRLDDFEVEDGLRLQLRVVDDLDHPVAGAEVEMAQGWGPLERRFSGSTGAGGAAGFRGLRADLGSTTIRVRHPAHDRSEIVLEILPVELEIRLRRLASVRASVQWMGGADSGPVWMRSGDRKVAKESPGLLVLDRLVPGEHRIVVGGAGRTAVAFPVRLGPGEELDLEEIRLGAAPVARFRFVEEDGKSSLGALFLGPEPAEDAELELGEEGIAALTYEGPEAPATIVSAPDRVPRAITPAEWIRALEAIPRERETISLQSGERIGVIAADEDGDPCAGCRFRIRPGGEVVRTDADGTALSGVLAPGRYLVEPELSAVVGTRRRTSFGGLSQAVELGAAGTAWVAFGDRPVALHLVWERSPDEPWRLRVLSPTGRAQLVEPRSENEAVWSWPGEVPATIFVERGPAYRDHIRLSRWVPGRPAQLTITEEQLARQAGVVHGQVRRVDGPVAEARIRLKDWDDHETAAATKTGTNGRFRLQGVPPGVYALWIDDRNHSSVRLERGRTLDLGSLLVP